MNFGTTQLEQILSMGQFRNNRNGLGYTNVADSVATTSKTVFVKTAPTLANHHVSSKISNPPLSEVKMKRFVPICHYCIKLGHILPRCFKYINTFRMNKIVKSACKPRTAPKHKIDLKNKSVKKICVKKS